MNGPKICDVGLILDGGGELYCTVSKFEGSNGFKFREEFCFFAVSYCLLHDEELHEFIL